MMDTQAEWVHKHTYQQWTRKYFLYQFGLFCQTGLWEWSII